MNGNVTKEGITADLEWMKRTGIAGMQMFDGNLGTPQFVEKRLVWMTPEWKEAFRHAGAEADRLGLKWRWRIGRLKRRRPLGQNRWAMKKLSGVKSGHRAENSSALYHIPNQQQRLKSSRPFGFGPHQR
jgi:hypothetical protein